jgi:hypothetical protein
MKLQLGRQNDCAPTVIQNSSHSLEDVVDADIGWSHLFMKPAFSFFGSLDHD